MQGLPRKGKGNQFLNGIIFRVLMNPYDFPLTLGGGGYNEVNIPMESLFAKENY